MHQTIYIVTQKTINGIVGSQFALNNREEAEKLKSILEGQLNKFNVAIKSKHDIQEVKVYFKANEIIGT